MSAHHGADSAPRFSLGKVLLTPGARQSLTHDEIDFALLRHQSGDWGDLDEADAARNEVAVQSDERLLSVYSSSKHVRFYVITEHDRSYTTVLLPHEY